MRLLMLINSTRISFCICHSMKRQPEAEIALLNLADSAVQAVCSFCFCCTFLNAEDPYSCWHRVSNAPIILFTTCSWTHITSDQLCFDAGTDLQCKATASLK